MPATHLSGRQARIDVSLDGIRFTRSEPDAARRNTEKVRDIAWDEVVGASVESSRKGRPVVRVTLVGVPVVTDHRNDPNSLKVRRNLTASAHQLVDQINAESEARRRWREASQSAG